MSPIRYALFVNAGTILCPQFVPMRKDGSSDERNGERKRKRKKTLLPALLLTVSFIVWTVMIRTIDIRRAGPSGTAVGFATLNVWFHKITGVHMLRYTISDWLGLVPIVICMCFGVLGLIQLIRKRSLLKVDRDILLLGIYYIIVILFYLFFEMIPVNYRPVLIDGRLEASYPSSTTLLVLSVMPTLKFQAYRRIGTPAARYAATVFAYVFSLFMVICRMISGVHWLTDIIGSVLLSSGLYMIYVYAVNARDRSHS